MAGLLNLTAPEIAMYCEEAAVKIAKGDTIEKVARDFRWAISDVKALVATKPFKDRLHVLAPDVAQTFTVVRDSGVDEVLEFIDQKMPDYIRRLDYFALNAQSEQVAFNALIKLISMRKVDQAAENTQTIHIDSRHEDRMVKALKEIIFSGETTEPSN